MHYHNTNSILKSTKIGENPIFPGILRKIPDNSRDTGKKPIKCLLKDACKGCEGKSGIIRAVDKSTGNPHSYRLSCADCGRFIRWIGEKEFTRKIGKMGGHGNA